MSEKKNKHTPGPWVGETAKSHGANITIYGTEAGDAVDVCDVVYRGDETQVEANAHLIAAAPDMLEALEAALAYLVMAGTDHAEPTRATIRAAIKKARGES